MGDERNGYRNDNRGLALGLRHSNDKALAVQIVGGARVFVCDNLALSGEKIAMRKHSRGLHLASMIREGLGRFLDAFKRFDAAVIRARRVGRRRAARHSRARNSG